MADISLGPYTLGIDHVSEEATLPPGAVSDAVNVDFDRAGGFGLRAGRSQLQATVDADSLWASPTSGRAYMRLAGYLVRARYPYATTQLAPLADSRPLSYADLNGEVVVGNEGLLLRVSADDSVQGFALERPSAPDAVALGGYGLNAGRYAVAVAFLRGNEEGALSPSTFVDVAEGGGFALDLPADAAGEATGVRVYRTQANGDVLYRVGDMPAGFDGYVLGASSIGRATDTQFLAPMVGGQIVRAWNGLLIVGRGATVRWSEPLRYGLTDPRHNFTQYAHRVTLLEPVDGGVYVGGAFGVVFLAGSSPKDWEARNVSRFAPIAGTGVRVEPEHLNSELAPSGAPAVMWLCAHGFVVGSSSGSVAEPQAKRIRIPASQVTDGVGASVIHDRQVIAVVN